MVNFPKQKSAYCQRCRKHTVHAVTQLKKAGKASLVAQGKRRYDRKQKGFGGQTKPVFKKNVKTTRKITLRLKCNTSGCGRMSQVCLKRCLRFELGAKKKE